jgi:uncharacterized protein (TIGR02246 family)
MRMLSAPRRRAPFVPPRTLGALCVLAASAACATAPGAPAGGATSAGGAAAAGALDAAARETVRSVVRVMMARGAAAWNRGDLDAFVDDYAPDTTTTYVGSRGLVRGRAAIRAAYAPRFAPGVQRGTLRFENMEIDVLAPDAAFAWRRTCSRSATRRSPAGPRRSSFAGSAGAGT